MPAIFFKRVGIGIAICGAVVLICGTARAASKHEYTETGTVISVDSDHAHTYAIETADRIYMMECTSVKAFSIGSPECLLAGKPIMYQDTVQFRRDGDTAYMPLGGDREEKLQIHYTQLKAMPPLAAGATTNGGESAAVRGTGIEISGYSKFDNSTPARAAGPSSATGMPGGQPGEGMPTGPAGGGMGGPGSGGSPAAPAPVPAGESETSVPNWIHFLRVQTAGHVYDLDCGSRPCSLNGKAVQLGDVLTIRIENKTARLALPAPGSAKEQGFAILATHDVRDVTTTPSH